MIIVRYGEIGLKGNKRREFEKILGRNIERKLKTHGYKGRIETKWGRIIVDAMDSAAGIIAKCPGIVSISPAKKMNYDEIFPYLKEELKKYNIREFRITAKRVDKKFPKKSMEINSEVGEFIVKNFGWKVNLKEPELDIGIEIINSYAYVFFDKIRGIGGLPVGVSGKVISLISSGIDSPVSTFLMMKRGARIIALHFSQKESERKVRKYVEVLNEYSPRDIELIVEKHGTLLGDYLEKLKNIKREEWTCIFCKYLMLKRAEEIGNKKNALGIVTGDSLGQVASQTLENMHIISSGIRMPVYRPLIGMDKTEIEKIAREIGTYDVFISSQEIKCPFKPRYVITKGDYNKFLEIKRKIGLN